MGERLLDRVALVFGAGSSGPGWGNGKATAVSFAREGAKVVAVDISMEAAEETAGLITEEGGQALALEADVTKPDSVQAAVAQTMAAFGRIDVLHNNVGIGNFGGPVDLPFEEWSHVIDVNLSSVFLACKYVLPIMAEQGGGVIINISSIASLGVGMFSYSAYYASKAGLNHLTRAVAIEYADKGIRANAILPGLIDTPMVRGSTDMLEHYGSMEELEAARHAASPTGRMGEAWDIAAAAVFLASDEAKYINGVMLPVDGGLSCRLR
jgi:NAD(P)-dependent dehydrogenase (short-subunit alcohol dehydrogenase family)